MDDSYEGDLQFAQACLDGDEAELERLESEYLSKLGPVIGRVDADEIFIDEVIQELRMRLLVGEDTRVPKLQTYSGRGPLGAWIAIVATRIALGLKRRSSKEFPKENRELEKANIDCENLELRIINDTYREDFRKAFLEAYNSLTSRERNILLMRFIDGMTVDKISVVYRVHRSTVTRWITRARAKIVKETRQRLQEKLQLSNSQMSSLIYILSSDFELSVSIIIANTESIFSK